MSQMQNSAVSSARRAHAEAALADYPHISEDRLAALIGWFRREASAFDVASLASNEAIAESYRRFRADHIDPVTGQDVVRGLLVLALVGAIILFIAWRAI
jgi:hypothetical protein